MRAVLFDLYGTLIDIHTDEDSVNFWKRISKKVNKYHSYTPDELKSKYKQICKEKEKQREEIDILEVFEELLSISNEEATKVAWQFRKASTKYVHLYRGVKKLLKRLKNEGVPLYVLSNAQEAFTLPELKKFKIDKYFDGIAISSAYGVKKPNIEFFQRAMKDFQLQDATMIGNDLECDILPAKELGLKTIFIESNLTFKKSVHPDLFGFDYKRLYWMIHTLY
ncbi:MAG: HAD family hydrolase [Anaeroplasmataceae bacterium]|nr:HAD family hydrolase [Anaeroplasmataceae bacterium]